MGTSGKVPLVDENWEIVGWFDQVTIEGEDILGRLSGIDPNIMAGLESGDVELSLQVDKGTQAIQAVRLKTRQQPESLPKKEKKSSETGRN